MPESDPRIASLESAVLDLLERVQRLERLREQSSFAEWVEACKLAEGLAQ